MQVLPPTVEKNPAGAKFRVGDKVIYTNGYGIVFADPRTITGLETWHGENYKSVRYYFEPTDTPWYPVAEEQLKHLHGWLRRTAQRLIELVLQKQERD